MENKKEKLADFKTAISSTVRSLSNSDKIEVSFGNDGNISEEKLESCINSDLANNFGNLCQRVLSFAEKNCSSIITDYKFTKEDLIKAFKQARKDAKKNFSKDEIKKKTNEAQTMARIVSDKNASCNVNI